MRKLLLPVIAAGLLLTVLAIGLIQNARGQGSAQEGGRELIQSESQGENYREITAPEGSNLTDQPNISFIDSPTAGCYQPDPTQDACYINWYYMYVDANPNYMIAMTVTLNAIGPVARFNGFFQTSMYAPYNMLGDGFKVACGPPGAGGNPNLGNAYGWTIRARDSSNLGSANYGTVFCPAYAP